MALDGLQAEEQLGGNLGIGLAVDDEPSYLKLSFAQGRHTGSVRLTGLRPTWSRTAELAQLTFCLVAIAGRTERVECDRRELQFDRCRVLLTCFRECPTCEQPRHCGVEGVARL